MHRCNLKIDAQCSLSPSPLLSFSSNLGPSFSRLKDYKNLLLPVLAFFNLFSIEEAEWSFTDIKQKLPLTCRKHFPLPLNKIGLFSTTHKAFRSLGLAYPLTSRDTTHISALALPFLGVSALPPISSHDCFLFFRCSSPERPSLTTPFSGLLSHYHIHVLFSSKVLNLIWSFVYFLAYFLCLSTRAGSALCSAMSLAPSIVPDM